MLPNLGRLTLAGDVATGTHLTVMDNATAEELRDVIEKLSERLKKMINFDPRVRQTYERQMYQRDDERIKKAKTLYDNTRANYPKMPQPRDREDMPNFEDAATTRPDQFVRSSTLDYINGDSPQPWWGDNPREDDGLDRPSGLQIRDEGREDREWYYKSLPAGQLNSLPAGPDDGFPTYQSLVAPLPGDEPPDSPIRFRDC